MNELNKILFDNKGFKINPMQEESLKLKGENVIINAPTGSGKTEAIILNMKDSGKYLYFLPTITSCIFMYRRLCDVGYLNVEIKTSILSESKRVNKDYHTVVICCPDQPLINHFNGDSALADYNGIILDEIDSYPEMVKASIIELLTNEKSDHHFIVASATIDKDLSKVFEKEIENKIVYSPFKEDFIKYKINKVNGEDDDCVKEIISIIKDNYKTKKIGFIMNDIMTIKNLSYAIDEHNRYSDEERIEYKTLHGDLDEYDRSEAEKYLYYDYTSGVFISNDLIGSSIDVDFDILFIQTPDQEHTLLQRMGRCNRNNKISSDSGKIYLLKCDDKIFSRGKVPRHIDAYESDVLYDKYTEYKELSYYDVEKFRSELTSKALPSFEDVKEHWEKLKVEDLELSLRDTCVKLKLPVFKEVNGEKIHTHRIMKAHGYGMPWGWYPYDENENKIYVHHKGTDYVLLNKNEAGEWMVRYRTEYDEMYSADYFMEDYDDDDDDYDDEESYEEAVERLNWNFDNFSSYYMNKLLNIYPYTNFNEIETLIYRLISGTSLYNIRDESYHSGNIYNYYINLDILEDKIKCLKNREKKIYYHMELTEYTYDNGIYVLETPLVFKRPNGDVLEKFTIEQTYDDNMPISERFTNIHTMKSAPKSLTKKFVNEEVMKDENIFFIGLMEEKHYGRYSNILGELLDTRYHHIFKIYTNFNFECESNHSLYYLIDNVDTSEKGGKYGNAYYTLSRIGERIIKLNIYMGTYKYIEEIIISSETMSGIDEVKEMIIEDSLRYLFTKEEYYENKKTLDLNDLRTLSIELFNKYIHKNYHDKDIKLIDLEIIHNNFNSIQRFCEEYDNYELVDKHEFGHLFYKYKKELYERMDDIIKKEEERDEEEDDE